MSWSRNHECCLKCRTTIYNHKGKGLCTRCYPVQKELEKIENANKEELEKYRISYLPLNNIIEIRKKDIKTQKEIIKSKCENKKLKYLKQYGEIESEKIKVDIVKLEMILNEISRRVGNKDNLYTNHLMRFKSHFSENQRRILALKLLYMLIK